MLLLFSWSIACQVGINLAVISIETPSKEHMDHFLIQKQLKQEMSSEECYFDNETWARVIEERKQEIRWEKRVEAYKAGLITTGLYVDEKDKKTHWTDRYSGFWFPHNFRRRRRSAADAAVVDLADQYRVLEVLRNTRQERRKRRKAENSDRMRPFPENDGDPLQLEPVKSNQRVRRKRSLVGSVPNKARHPVQRHLVERLRRSLLARQKRHLSEREKEFMDPYAFEAKDYNYYDYNNMLTAITLASSTIKFVEECKKNKPDVAQANDVHTFNRKHKNVWGGFHNDSEMLTFLRNYHYTNFTHEERKMAFFDDFMLNRVNARVEFFKQNLANYKKHYRALREKSNREGHRFVDPDTEDQSAIIPDFEEHGVLNFTELYRYFRAANDHADYKSSEIEPEPVNHYMPENHTDSPEDHVYRSGEVEAFQSDYEEGRINTSCWTKFRRRRLATSPYDIHIDIKVINKYYPDHDDDLRKNGRHNGVSEKRNNNARDDGEKNIRAKTIQGEISLKDIVDVNDGKSSNDNQHNVNIMYKTNQNNVRNNGRFSENNRNSPVKIDNAVCSNDNFNALGEVLNLLKDKVDMNVVRNFLNKVQWGQSLFREKGEDMGGVFGMIKNIIGDYGRNSRTKSFKVFEIFEIQIDEPKRNSLSRLKRSVSDRTYLALNKVLKTVDNNDRFVLHLYLTPTDENEALGLNKREHRNNRRSKRNVAPKAKANSENEEVESKEDPDLCPMMKRVFYWKDIREKNKNIVMSHEASIDAISMDDWHKRRDRRIKGITTKEELLERIENEKQDKIRQEEDRIAEERQDKEAAKHAPEEEPTNDPNECPMMQKVYYWKKVRDQSEVVMSHEKSIDAVSMDDWQKRRDRHIKGCTKPGEDYRPEYEDTLKGKRIDPSKGEQLRRKKRENSEEMKGFQDPAEKASDDDVHGCAFTLEPPELHKDEEPVQACPLTYEPPKGEEPVRACPLTFKAPEPSNDEPVQACPLTFEPQQEEEPIRACPLTFKAPEPSNDEPVQACPLTFEPQQEEEPIRACPFTFKAPEPPKEEPFRACPITFDTPEILKEDTQAANPEEEPLNHFEAREKNEQRPGGTVQKTFKAEFAAQEEKQPWAGFSEFQMYPKVSTKPPSSPVFKPLDNWSVRIPKDYRQVGFSPYVISRANQRYHLTTARRTYVTSPITKVVEPKFIRLIYNGKGYVRHVHYITNREFQKKKFVRDYYGVKNVYLENFLLEKNETQKARARAEHNLPRLIQNHYVDGTTNITRFINLYYDSEGDLIYTTVKNKYRVPIKSRGMNNKYEFRSYFSRGLSRSTLTKLREPVLVQLHYKF